MKKSLKEALNQGQVCLLPSGGLPGLSFASQNALGKQQLLRIKGREEEKGIVSLVDSLETAIHIWQPLPSNVEQELKRHWPKGLTLVYAAKKTNSSEEGFLHTGSMQDGEYFVGLRIPTLGPELAWVADLLEQVKVLASSSVNTSGEESLSDWPAALAFARDHRAFIDPRVEELSRQTHSIASPSTVAKILPEGKLAILRQGNICDQLADFLGRCNGK